MYGVDPATSPDWSPREIRRIKIKLQHSKCVKALLVARGIYTHSISPKVDYLHVTIVCKEDILELEVPEYDPPAIEVLQSEGNLRAVELRRLNVGWLPLEEENPKIRISDSMITI